MLRSKRINYNEIIKKLEFLQGEKKNARLLIISSDRKEEDGLYHLTVSNGKGSKMLSFGSMEEIEKYIESKDKRYRCVILRVGVLED